MSITPFAIILASCLSAPTESRFAEAVQIYVCNFEHAAKPAEDTDINYDGWPDNWTRQEGLGYPAYLDVGIAPDPEDEGNHRLQIQLDGGAAAAYSPPLDTSPMFSYVLEARLQTKGLQHDTAYFSVTFFDQQHQALETHYTEAKNTAGQWTNIRIGPVTPKSPLVREAKIGVHLRPPSEDRFDLWGSAMFDDIWFARLPRMSVTANREFHIYEDAADVELTCSVSGIDKSSPRVRFELFDAYGRVLAEETLDLVVERIDDAPQAATSGAGGGGRQEFEGQRLWKPPLPAEAYGFYQVRASINSDAGALLTRTVSLVVVRPGVTRRRGEFGWSLPQGEDPLPLRQLALLLNHVGVNWVKYPIWFDDASGDLPDRLAWFAERLSSSGVNLVGVLDQPPAKADEQSAAHIPVALVFGDQGVWKPLVNPVMTRLSLKLRWWQLGADDDVSFVGFPDFENKVAEIKSHLERFGQEIQLGVSWRWLNQAPQVVAPAWQFLSYTVDKPFTSVELSEALKAEKKAPWRRWIMLEPLPSDSYDLDARARDLVLRMVEGKINQADGIFIPDPFDKRVGLMRPDGSPGELLLPWRTTALHTAGAEFIGSIEMPNKSRNYVFARDGEALMIVWNDTPIEEVLYVGEADSVTQIDVWGRETKPKVVQDQSGTRRQVLPVGRVPTFLTGVNLPVAKWRMAFRFNTNQLLSTFGAGQAAQYTFRNDFEQAVSGQIRLITPTVWDVEPAFARFDLSAGDQREQSFEVKLHPDANSGDQPVRVDFEIIADRPYRFSVYRSMEVGLGDVTIEVRTDLDLTQDRLVVTLILTNKQDLPARFNCYLLHPTRRRMRLQINSSGRGRTSAQFSVAKGGELLDDDLYVRAEEIGGSRVLNYQVKAD